MNHAINCEISEKLSENCTCGVDMAVPIAAVPPSLNGGGTPLRPCPLCQCEALGKKDRGSYTIECPRCNLGLIADTEAEAKAAWNSRVAPPLVAYSLCQKHEGMTYTFETMVSAVATVCPICFPPPSKVRNDSSVATNK